MGTVSGRQVPPSESDGYHQGVQVMPESLTALVDLAQTRKARLEELLVGWAGVVVLPLVEPRVNGPHRITSEPAPPAPCPARLSGMSVKPALPPVQSDAAA
ncbi:hypothetical protein AB0D49_25440 [Streptomyces sp. NPDC048290]|uniref:hypothetical protein n=1 Tax=Streptomyces sp. NPDC048290 TaxID=3155811 RepID=UPI00344238A7